MFEQAKHLALQQYGFNDHLASLLLAQGHFAWKRKDLKAGSAFETRQRYYQDAIVCALRYNRFLLDTVLAQPETRSLRLPIIPNCLARGEEGQRMLAALLEW